MEPFHVRVEVRAFRRQADGFDPDALQNGPKPGTERCVPVHEDVADSEEETFTRVREIAGDLLHPGFVWMGRATRKMDPSSGQLHHEEHVVGDQSALRPDFDRGEVDRAQGFPVGLEERFPSGRQRLPLPFGSGFDPMLLQDVADGLVADLMSEVGKRSLDAVVSPSRVLSGHPECKVSNVLRHRRTAGTFLRAICHDLVEFSARVLAT